MKRATFVSGLGLLIGLLLVADCRWGPCYERVPLTAPISFAGAPPEPIPFRVGRSEDYQIEVYFKRPRNPDDLVSILGGRTRKDVGALNMSWEVFDGGVAVASGSNRDYGYSPISGATEGVTLGTFPARRGTSYMLRLKLWNHEPTWNAFDPHVEIALHPAKLEYLLVYGLFGMVLTVLCGAIFISCVVVVVRRGGRGSRHEQAPGI